VQDTGPGIAPEEQPRVFERFYQSRQRRAEGGTGIGLAFSRELAELMHGTLTLASQPGRGSAFTLTLPGTPLPPTAVMVAEEPTVQVEEAPPVVEVMPGEIRPRVLVVEDNADLRTYLRQVLAPLYEVLEAENGPAALDVLRRDAVDLICSDEMMPHLSGTELLLRLKAESRWRRVPFLMVTARSDAEHRFRALELGVDDYLQKPFAPRELLARAHNLLVNYRERLAFARGEERGVSSDEVSEETGNRREGAADVISPGAPTVAGQAMPTLGRTATDTVVLAESEFRTVADQELLRRVREVAEAAVAETDFDTPQLVAKMGVSERTLYRKLKELTGLTPAAYLREVRLEHARQLLERRAMQTVAEVAYAVGFDNPGYFATVFLKRYGKRATEYLQ
jgi:DNA-binding response OmpR family regulator